MKQAIWILESTRTFPVTKGKIKHNKAVVLCAFRRKNHS